MDTELLLVTWATMFTAMLIGVAATFWPNVSDDRSDKLFGVAIIIALIALIALTVYFIRNPPITF